MIERKTFELDKAQTNKFPMPVITLGTKSGQSVLIGNPSENQYLSLTLRSFGRKRAVFCVKEILEDKTFEFGSHTIDYWTRYTIKNTTFSIEARKNTSGSGITLILSNYENIDNFLNKTRKL